ncbi:unnamed protein product, partial [Prorocentrum cordatum]
MPAVPVTVHTRGLHPLQAAMALHLQKDPACRAAASLPLVFNMAGPRPSVKAVWNAIKMVGRTRETGGPPQTKCANCGRGSALSPEQENAAVAFVQQNRNKRFCCCRYIRTVLELKCTKRTVVNVLKRHGCRWRAVPKVRGFDDAELQKRRDWVNKCVDMTPERWLAKMNLVLDGAIPAMAPKPLDKRQRHLAQTIRHAWMRKGEDSDPDCHLYNGRGIRLGTAVPLR